MIGRGEILDTVVQALETSGIPYMLTGSVASTYHGIPRATQDIDIVIAPTEASLDKLVSLFPDGQFYLDRDKAREALSRISQFNLIEGSTGWKVDFIIRKNRPFNLVEFGRRMTVDIAGLNACMATAEDVILAKLEWAADSQSDRQIEDAAGIIRRQGANLNDAYLQEWVEKLGLDAEWMKAKRFAAD